MKNSFARDVYGTYINLLKQFVNGILEPLSKHTNEVSNNGIFPDTLKLSKMMPILKRGSRDDPSSYRPIPIFPSFGKLIEIVIKDQISQYLKQGNFLLDNQFGFHPDRSTTSEIVVVLDNIYSYFDNKHFFQAMSCDFSDAFDCMSHDLLIEKVHFL